MTHGEVGFDPRTTKRPFRSFFSCDDAWVVIRMTERAFALSIKEDRLSFRSLHLTNTERATEVRIDERHVPFSAQDGMLRFDATATHSITVLFS
ncbi:MAG: hypothetical protein IJ009_07860 [Clostridia bacterium]|nr:hypothetical protein [Clostridia bacterium]